MNLLTFNALMSIDPETLEPVTDLAESYETVSDTEWVFTLKQGVTFHDGSTLDAQDVKASMEYAKTYPTTKDYTSFWTDIQVVDDTHVKITTDGPYACLLYTSTAFLLHFYALFPSSMQKTGESHRGNSLNSPTIGQIKTLIYQASLGNFVTVLSLSLIHIWSWAPHPFQQGRNGQGGAHRT